MERPDDKLAGWHAQTELATRLVARDDDEAPTSSDCPDLGRLVAPDQRELFVTCAAVDALALQFTLRPHVFVHVHDVQGGREAMAFLEAMAQSKRASIQALSIRRQGHGDLLASVLYLDVPHEGGASPIRLYALAQQPEGVDPDDLSRAMLAHAAMTVLVFAGEPAPSLTARVQALVRAWRNPPSCAEHQSAPLGGLARLVVWLPVGTVGAQVAALGQKIEQWLGTKLRQGPPIRMAADAWPYLSSTWKMVSETHRSASEAARKALAVTTSTMATGAWALPAGLMPASTAPAAPADLPPIDFHPVAPASIADERTGIEQYAQDLANLSEQGAALILEANSSRVRTQVIRGADDPASLARLARLLMATMSSAGKAFNASAPSTIEWGCGSFHACLRPVPEAPELICLTVIQPAPSTALAPWRAALARVEANFRR
jgi:hypothetical protein